MLRDVVRTLTRRAAPAAPGSVGELVFSGPLPPARTGVATYDRAVLDGLRRIGFFDRHRMDVLWPIEPKHAPRLPGYRLGVFELGNNVEFHLEAYRAAFLAQSSLIVLHDLALDDFVRGLRTLGDPLGFMATREAAALRLNLHSPDVVRNEPLREPWCAHVARRARGIIVHSAFCARYLRGGRLSHARLRRAASHRRVGNRHAARGRSRASSSARSVRRRACDRSSWRRATSTRRSDSTPCWLPRTSWTTTSTSSWSAGASRATTSTAVVDAARLGDRVTLAPDVSDDDFRGWLAAADVVVDLRFPHRGEVSGSLIRAMQAGKPSIVSATGTYLDAPDDAVLRVAPGPTDPVRAGRADPFAPRGPRSAGPDGRSGASARRRRSERRRPPRRATRRRSRRRSRLVRDPAHKALAIWGKALADLGADEADLRDGLGVDYARALATFRGTS